MFSLFNDSDYFFIIAHQLWNCCQQALVFASKEGILTEEMIDRTVKLAIADHAEKVLWDSVGRPEIVYVEKAMKDSASSN